MLRAAEDSTGQTFTTSAGISGTSGVLGDQYATVGSNADQGAAYLFRGLDTASGTITPSVTLTASDGAVDANFGFSVDLLGTVGLVGAWDANVSSVNEEGAAYVFRNLDTATGTITQNVKLVASDGATGAQFGSSTSLASTTGSAGLIGLVGAVNGVVGGKQQGAAYVFRNLDTATGTITQSLKLTASDGAVGDAFGYSTSLAETAGSAGLLGLVGAYQANVGANNHQGVAYVFRNLDTNTGTVTQNAKLIATDGATDDGFAYSVSLYGTMGLAGAPSAKIGSNNSQGAVYLFRNLDTATGTINQSAKLIASDGAAADGFGNAVSLSGTTALVGASDFSLDTGAAYLYFNLGTATGTITQDVKLTASSTSGHGFGLSVALDGDNFIIAVENAAQGAYSGSVSSITTMDTGNTTRTISGISFISQDDWIIGKTTSNNSVTLSDTDTANVTASGKAVSIGQNSGSNNNTLEILGKLTTNSVTVGGTGDTLWVQGDASGDGQVTASGGVTVKSGAVLKGTPIGTSRFAGTITSVVSLLSGATITGSLNLVGSQTMVGGAAYAWNVNAAPAAGTAATNWDFINITGGLNITATSGNQFTIDIDGNLTGLGNFQLYDWTILTASSGFGGTFNANEFALNTTNFTSNTGGTFSVLAQGNNLELQFASAPEPGRVMLLGLGVMVLITRRRRLG